MTIKSKLPPITESMREAARRMADKTGLSYEDLLLQSRAGVQTVNVESSRVAKEKALERGDMDAYRAWMIKEARFAAGLTQDELAKLMDTSQPAIARLEDPKYSGQSLDTLMKIAKVLGMRLQPPMFVPDESAV